MLNHVKCHAASTVMNMWNDRYETIFSPFSMIIRLVLG